MTRSGTHRASRSHRPAAGASRRPRPASGRSWSGTPSGQADLACRSTINRVCADLGTVSSRFRRLHATDSATGVRRYLPGCRQHAGSAPRYERAAPEGEEQPLALTGSQNREAHGRSLELDGSVPPRQAGNRPALTRPVLVGIRHQASPLLHPADRASSTACPCSPRRNRGQHRPTRSGRFHHRPGCRHARLRGGYPGCPAPAVPPGARRDRSHRALSASARGSVPAYDPPRACTGEPVELRAPMPAALRR